MNWGYYFGVLFSVNVLLSFFIRFWDERHNSDSLSVDRGVEHILSCGLFALLLAIFSQIAYLINFFIPALSRIYVLPFLTSMGVSTSFLFFSQVVLGMKDSQRNQALPFVYLNTLALILPYAQDESFFSPWQTALFGFLTALMWLLGLATAYLFEKKFEIEIPRFSCARLPLFIITVGGISLILTPLIVAIAQ